MAQYQPDRGHVIYLDLDPRTGVELGKRRPALVLSPKNFNIATGMAAVCPITNTETGSSFEVSVPRGAKLSGCVVTNQFRTVDWIARNADYHSEIGQDALMKVIGRVEAILGLDLDP